MADILGSIGGILRARKPGAQMSTGPGVTYGQAQDRFMRTPVSFEETPRGIQGAGGSYASGNISVTPEAYEAGEVMPHELAHRIFDEGNLGSQAKDLAPKVPNVTRRYIESSPLYQGLSGAGSPEQISNEGLAYSLGDSYPPSQGYVADARSRLSPSMQRQLDRLRTVALGRSMAARK